VLGYVLLHTTRDLEENLAGKRIVFGKWSEREFELGGVKFQVISEEDVLAVVEEES